MELSDWFPARFGGRQGIVGPASENRGFLTRPLACHFDASVDVTDVRKQDAVFGGSGKHQPTRTGFRRRGDIHQI